MDKYQDMDPVALLEEVRKLDARINSPIIDDFIAGVRNEAVHQVGRWGSAHDRGKTALDWFWLIGFLAQKAATSQIAAEQASMSGRYGDAKKHREKALHHTISTSAALLNWHAQISGAPIVPENSMRPGTEQD